MNWLEAYEILSAELRYAFDGLRLRSEFFPKFLSAVERFDHGIKPSKKADAACRHFAAKRMWPKIDQKVAVEVLFRLCEAADFAAFVVGPKSPRIDGARSAPIPWGENLLQWLLVDYWKMAGFWRRLYQFGSHHRQVPVMLNPDIPSKKATWEGGNPKWSVGTEAGVNTGRMLNEASERRRAG